MTTQQTPLPPSRPIIDKRISLELARIRVTRWLNLMRDVLGPKVPACQIPRAVYISIEDINQLMGTYKEVDLKGIRVYFGLAGEDHIQPANVTELRGMIVPVLYASEVRPHADYITTDSTDSNYTDIYDFTAPCPKFCDEESELYVPMPENAVS